MLYFMKTKDDSVTPYAFVGPTVSYNKTTTVFLLMFSFIMKLQQWFLIFLWWENYDSVTHSFPLCFFFSARHYIAKKNSVTPYFSFGPTAFYYKKTKALPLKFSFITTKYDSVTSLCILFIIGRKTTLLPIQIFLAQHYFIAKNDSVTHSVFIWPDSILLQKMSGTLMFFYSNDKKTTALSLMFSSITAKWDSVTPEVFFHKDKLQQCYPFGFLWWWEKYDSVTP